MLASALSLLKYEKEYMLAAWGMALLITILFLIDELGNRSFDFTVYLFVSLSPSNFLRALMLLVSILMFCLGLLNALYLFVRKIPLQYRLLSKQFAKNKEPKEGWQHTVTFYIWSRILSSVAYNLYVIVFLLATLVHPFFAGFLLVEVISRIEMGRFIITSIKETWFQFMAVAGLLLISNFAYASYIYDFQTSDVGYGDICKDIYRCVLFMNDQSFKNGSGLFGSAITVDYNYMYISIKLLGELAYLVFIQKVIFEIFAGTVFDKFS